MGRIGGLLATNKLEGPSTSLSVLGLLHTSHRNIWQPSNKLVRIQKLMKTGLPKKQADSITIVGTIIHVMSDISYLCIRVIYVSCPCALGLALRDVCNIFIIFLNGAGGGDHYYSVEIMPDFSDRLNR